MKKSNYFLAILAVLFSFTACNNIPEPPYPTPPEGQTVIFFETFGNPSANIDINTYTGFVTTGYGAGAVTFFRAGGLVDVRSSSPSNFLGASGEGNVLFSAGSGGALFVNDIAVCGARNLVLSFATNQIDEIVTVAYIVHGEAGKHDWIHIPFERVMSGWGLVDNLRITLPEGTNTISLRFTALPVQFGARIDDIRITTTDDIINPETEEVNEPIIDPINNNGTSRLEVLTSSLAFSEDGGSIPIDDITSNIVWTATSSDPANFAVTTTANTITVTATPNTGASRTASITVRTIDQEVTRTINVTQDGDITIPVSTLIFNETFGNPTANTDINTYTGFVTTGIGAGNVTFSRTGGLVDVRTTSPSIPTTGANAGVPLYPGASGEGNVLFSAGSGGTLYVDNIAVCNAQNLILSFGTNQTNDIMSVAYSVNGDGVWTTIPFTKTTSAWGLVDNLNITLPAGTNTISLRFTAEPVQFGARIDDITIVTYDTTSGC